VESVLPFKVSPRYFSKRFGWWLREKAGVKDARLVFHSTRHSFADALRRAGVPEDIRDALLGHSSGGKIGRRYGTGHSLRALKEAINRVNYSGGASSDVE